MTQTLTIPDQSLWTPQDDFDLRQMLISSGMIPSLAALDQGTSTVGDIITQTADGRDLNDIWAEMAEALNAWNAGRTALQNAISYSVPQNVEDVAQFSQADFEEASEFGVPKGIRGGGYFSMGFTFKWYDLASRFTWQFLADASAGQVQNNANMAFEADNRLVFNLIMSAAFRNINRVATINQNAYNVYPFYNNDGTVPPAYAMYTFDGTHDHYLVSGGATVDSGDLDEMETHLVHHGYSPANGSTLVLLVNRQEMQTIRSFRIASGDSFDYIPRRGNEPFLVPENTRPEGQASIPSAVLGLPVEGAYGKWLVVENDYIPAGYMFGFASGGPDNLANPIGVREHSNASLRGLRLVRGAVPDYPLIDSYYQRGVGTGVRHRGAGVITQVKAAGNYDVPSQYNLVG